MVVVMVVVVVVVVVVVMLAGIERVFFNVAILYLCPRGIRRGFAVGRGVSPGLDGHDASRRIVNIDVWGERELVQSRFARAHLSSRTDAVTGGGEIGRKCTA